MTILNCYNVTADGTGVNVHVKNPDNSGNNYLIDLKGAKKPPQPKIVWQGKFPPLDPGTDRRDLWLPQSVCSTSSSLMKQDASSYMNGIFPYYAPFRIHERVILRS
jgi:hypothetical protein